MFDLGTFDAATFDAGLFASSDVAAAVTSGGAWYPTPEELERLRAYRAELDEAHELPRKKRRKLEQDLTETIRKAYQRAVGEEPEAAEEFIEAVAAIAPAAVKAVEVTTALPEFAPVVSLIDWAMIGRDLGAMKQLMGVIEARAATRAYEAFRAAEIERIRLDEEDIEVLLLGI
jgi:hypothetical protein